MFKRKDLFLFLTVWLFSHLSLAAPAARGVGAMAKNVMEPVSLLSDFVNSACFIIGASFLFASLIKYLEHRRSPLMVPISTVIFLMLGGIVLILLPFAYMLTEGGIRYSLLR